MPADRPSGRRLPIGLMVAGSEMASFTVLGLLLDFGLGTMLHDLAPALAKRLRPFVAMLVALMSLVMLGLAIKMSMQAWNSMYTTLPISQATVYVVMAITFAAMALFAIEPLVAGEEAATT